MFTGCGGEDAASPPTNGASTGRGEPVATSQLALPKDACTTVFAVEGYEQSVANLNQVSLQRDNVFSEDGAARQLATTSGDIEAGYTATLTIPV